MDKEIYEYQDFEGNTKRADPMRLFRRLQAAMVENNTSLEAINAKINIAKMGGGAFGTPELAAKDELSGLEAVGQLATLAYRVFDAKPVQDDGTGWTESFAVRTLNEFLAWQEHLMGEPKSSPAPVPSTAPAGS